MTTPGRRARALAAGAATGSGLLAVALLGACAARPHQAGMAGTGTAAGRPGLGTGSAQRAAGPRLGTRGTFAVGDRWVTFTEPAHAGVTGAHLGTRRLLTQVFYPLARTAPANAGGSGSGQAGPAGPARGPLPMIVFGPGFMQCGAPYSRLLKAWASAGYVVVVVNFPYSDCKAGQAATESDMVNQPGDMSYVIGRMLRRSRARTGFFSGLISRREIAVTGQSDGGDTVAAVAANTCCTDRRVAAVAVLSGAEWPPMPGRYFTRRPVPMLFTQGSADTINPPGCSVVMYRADPARARYYLDLSGADHTVPYWGVSRYERTTARVTTEFFDRFVLGQDAAGPAMRRDGTVPGLAALYRHGLGRFPSTYCNT